MLHFWDAHWDLDVAVCPCDVHFCEWLEQNGQKNKTIFHFGTGGHHILGIHNVDKKLDNAILGITASPSEIDNYEKLIIERPAVGWGYKAFFGDIYQLDARLLPEFDIVTLFHVGEFRSEKNDAYGGLTDEKMVRILASRTRTGGVLAFYSGSFAFDKAQVVIDTLVKDGVMEPAGTFKTLPLFRRTAKPAL